MRPRVFIETTIPSYLTAWTSRDLLRAAHQRVTQEWWDRRDEYELFVSPLVLEECRRGDPTAAKERILALAGLTILDLRDEVLLLAQAITRIVPMPPRAAPDAVHIATAAYHGLQYLLTWNCTHNRERDQPPLVRTRVSVGRVRTTHDLHAARIAERGEGLMIEDEVVREVRAIREAFSESFGNDIPAMIAALRQISLENGWELVSLAPRPAVHHPVLPRRTPVTISDTATTDPPVGESVR